MINNHELIELCSKYSCKIYSKCLLKNYTTFKIGGECAMLIDVNSAEAAAELVKYLKSVNIKYYVIGNGSNILAADEGYDGVILHFGSDFSKIEIHGNRIISEGGASLAGVCIKAQQNGLSGMENLYGIPGSVGGGLFMNAGAYGSEMKDVVISADYIDESGTIHSVKVEDMGLSYRRSIFSDRKCIIISVVFELKDGDPEKIKKDMTACMKKRHDKQPLEYASAGSTFKRPEGSYASLLIEQCGLKGMTIGGAQVSRKHSGFVINTGNASCEDVLRLCDRVRKIVLEKTGYSLELEPVILK